MLDSAGKTAQKWNGELPTENVSMWGSTGTGKSHWANSQEPQGYLLKENVKKLLDPRGRENHKTVGQAVNGYGIEI
jgi:hypothetical protein